MIEIVKKIKFSKNEDRMKDFGNIKKTIVSFSKGKNKNLHYVLQERFEWMNKYIKKDDIGLEVGAAAGFSKEFILNKNFKISDLADYEHLDYKNIDAHSTKFKDSSFDYVIASHMVHHIAYPIKFFREMYRILKKDGKLIIYEAYASVLTQFIEIIMRHEGFDWTKDIWNESVPATEDEDVWSGNIAIPHLVFDDINAFNKNLGSYFKIEHDKILHELSYLNSGGVCSKTFYIPLNYFVLNILDKIYYFLSKPFPKIFAIGRRLVLRKI